MGIVAAIAIPSIITMTDRLKVLGARQDVVLGLWAARNAASMRGEFASFVLHDNGELHVIAGVDTVFRRHLVANRGVEVDVTRDSITYAPTGMGYGAANTRIVVSRGRRADTVTTSRLGRVSFR
jgi:type II secretory pathway pseudopilin PulG